jgi:phage tail-like protein
MAEDGSARSSTNWPLPRFYFQVSWGTGVMTFQEVAGLETEARTVAYRHGDNPQFGAALEMPALKKHGDVTLKRGLFQGAGRFEDWFDQLKMSTVARQAMTIRLLDESGQPTMTWTLARAWPSKITGTDLQGEGSEAVVESLVVTHEGLTIAVD